MKARKTKVRGLGFESESFGGLGKRGRPSHPKTARPFHAKKPMHIVLKSSRAKGKASLDRHAKAIEKVLADQSKIFGVKLYQSVNAGPYLHLVIRAKSREALRGYLRAVPGLIARKVLGIERGEALAEGDAETRDTRASRGKKFWDVRPVSNLVNWGSEYARLKGYLQSIQNQ